MKTKHMLNDAILFMLFVAGFLLLTADVSAEIKNGMPIKEIAYQRAWCGSQNGEREYRLKDNTRVDCLTKDYAVEMDFAYKWAESIGQSLHYARMTGQRAMVILIITNEDRDRKHVNKVKKMIAHFGLPITLKLIDKEVLSPKFK